MLSSRHSRLQGCVLRRKPITDDRQSWKADEFNTRTPALNFGGGGGGGSGTSTTTSTPGEVQVTYSQSPEQEKLWAMLFPVVQNLFPYGEATSNLYNQPYLNYAIPEIPSTKLEDYLITGDYFKTISDQMSPALWSAYQENVEDPLAARYGQSGVLGSAVGGLSGAAADALAARRGQAGQNINKQVMDYAQAPLLQAFKEAQDMAKFGSQQFNEAQRANWESAIQELQYPYQILTSLFGGSMPSTFVTQGGGTSTTHTEQDSGGK